MTVRPVKRALLSVWDKRGLVNFASRLEAAGVLLVSSGGTAHALTEAGIAVTPVADVTDSPEILGGRVKTLHPRIHGGILARPDDPTHIADLDAHGIEPFDLVAVNLYPFETTVVGPDITELDAIEQIDIGGPAMLRAAAKNHDFVAVVTSPDKYDEIATAVEAGGTTHDLRRRLATAAFSHTAAYDAAIAGWLQRDEVFPEMLVLAYERATELRYGENPHQNAALYRLRGADPWWQRTEQLQGKAMSFNNYNDTEAAWRLANDLATPGCVVVKHANPAGAAEGDTIGLAFRAAWDCDPVSAFGGIVAVNAALDEDTARQIGEYFTEVVIAPAVTAAAAEVLAARKNLRVLVAPAPDGVDVELRSLENGVLAQVRDRPQGIERWPDDWSVVSQQAPTESEQADLRFAWVVAAHTKSNAIVVATNRAAVGVGAGDQSRIGAAERALARAGDRSRGAVAASDAFFPFRDGLDKLARAGITAIIEPGGSVRDDEVVAAADEQGIALVFAHRRHFRH